jgi:maleate cis-trans isomerase
MGTLLPQTSSAMTSRRSLVRGAACACLSALPALGGMASPANAWTTRGFVGSVKPRAHDLALAEMIRLLPPGIGVAVAYLNFTAGTREELQNSFELYEKNIAYLASQKCDTISIEGAPPFMILGPESEARLVDGWKQKYKTDMFTSSQNQVNVLKALNVKNILGISEFNDELNRSYTKYFEDCGIGVAAMVDMDVAFGATSNMAAEDAAAFIRKKFAEHRNADAVYILGSGLNILDSVDELERELGVPFVSPIAARVWEIERRLHIHEPVKGYGRLLATLPG